MPRHILPLKLPALLRTDDGRWLHGSQPLKFGVSIKNLETLGPVHVFNTGHSGGRSVCGRISITSRVMVIQEIYPANHPVCKLCNITGQLGNYGGDLKESARVDRGQHFMIWAPDRRADCLPWFHFHGTHRQAVNELDRQRAMFRRANLYAYARPARHSDKAEFDLVRHKQDYLREAEDFMAFDAEELELYGTDATACPIGPSYPA